MKRKNTISFYRSVLTVAFLCLFFPPLFMTLQTGVPAGPRCFCASLLAACIVLLLLPIMDERAEPSFYYALGVAVAVLCGTLAGLRVRVWLALALAVHFCYLGWRSARRYAQLRPLFQNIAVWHHVENHARYSYALLLYLLVAVFPDQDRPGWTGWVALVPSVTLFVLLLCRVRTGRTFFIPVTREVEIKELVKGNLRSAPPQTGDSSAEMAKMARLYSRVVTLMEEKRPYLDSEFSMNDLSLTVFCNRTYLSKTINILSGRNFSQFVNYYRVQYCVELIRQNPNMRIFDLAMMSGFHSTVSFNMAFKLNMGETPSSFQERVRAERLAQ